MPQPTCSVMHLSLRFAVMEFKNKYARTHLGYAWCLGGPALFLALGYWVSANVVRDVIADRWLFVLEGILFWNFLRESTTLAASLFSVRANLINTFAVPPVALVLGATIAVFGVFLIQQAAGLLLLGALGSPLARQASWGMFCGVVVEIFFLAFALNWTLAHLCAWVADLRYIWMMVLQATLLACPVVYSSARITGAAHTWFFYSPLTRALEDLRATLDGSAATIAMHGQAALCAAILSLTLVAAMLERRFDGCLAERV